MSVPFADTIVALSSGRLPAGVAIIRVSGQQTRFALETIAKVPEPRLATYAVFRDLSGQALDRGLLLFFPGPASFTGEDCAEFHIHGSRAVAAALLGALVSIPGLRLAEPGEFTRRAFLNGKVDLLQAEALADLVSAETEAQRRLAVYNSEGAQSDLYQDWRRQIIHARAMIEAELDFAEEADIPGSISYIVWDDLARLSVAMRAHISGYRAAEIIRDGFDVVIVGAPNAGKSSLLNALARRDVALVSDEPGTTRDLVEVELDIGGMKIRITDTAGMRPEAGKVEAMGIERARSRASDADLILYVVDAASPVVLNDLPAHMAMAAIGTKADLVTRTDEPVKVDMLISSKTGSGMDEMLGMLEARAKDAVSASGEVLPSRLRHVSLLSDAVGHLEAALTQSGAPVELRAEELRLASNRLGRIAGVVDVEDLLDVIFSQFCVGK